MNQFPMTPKWQEKNTFPHSCWLETCPRCGAAPLCWCRSAAGKRIGPDPHIERRGAGNGSAVRPGYHWGKRL
jgi:hypothetical protein